MIRVEHDSGQAALFVLDIEEGVAFHRLCEEHDLALTRKRRLCDFLGDVLGVVLVVPQVFLEAFAVLVGEFRTVGIRWMPLFRALTELRRGQVFDAGLVVPVLFCPATRRLLLEPLTHFLNLLADVIRRWATEAREGRRRSGYDRETRTLTRRDWLRCATRTEPCGRKSSRSAWCW